MAEKAKRSQRETNKLAALNLKRLRDGQPRKLTHYRDSLFIRLESVLW